MMLIQGVWLLKSVPLMLESVAKTSNLVYYAPLSHVFFLDKRIPYCCAALSILKANRSKLVLFNLYKSLLSVGCYLYARNGTQEDRLGNSKLYKYGCFLLYL